MSFLPRFGIVDLGSNALRLIVAEASGSAIAVLESHRLPVRLGRDVFETGQVPEVIVSAVVGAFRRFGAICDRLAVGHVRAIATAAMRDARNRDLVIDRVRDATGIEIEVISGTREAHLLARAVQQQIDLQDGRSVLVDVGGGSVEVVLVEDGQITAADSYQLGALRMLALLDESESGESYVDRLECHLQGLDRQLGDRIAPGRIDRYIAVGGSIESLADLIVEGARRGKGLESLSLEAVRAETRAIASLPVAERIERKGLKPDRADIIVPAGVVYARLGEIVGIDSVLVPRVGIKEGLLAELAAAQP